MGPTRPTIYNKSELRCSVSEPEKQSSPNRRGNRWSIKISNKNKEKPTSTFHLFPQKIRETSLNPGEKLLTNSLDRKKIFSPHEHSPLVDSQKRGSKIFDSIVQNNPFLQKISQHVHRDIEQIFLFEEKNSIRKIQWRDKMYPLLPLSEEMGERKSGQGCYGTVRKIPPLSLALKTARSFSQKVGGSEKQKSAHKDICNEIILLNQLHEEEDLEGMIFAPIPVFVRRYRIGKEPIEENVKEKLAYFIPLRDGDLNRFRYEDYPQPGGRLDVFFHLIEGCLAIVELFERIKLFHGDIKMENILYARIDQPPFFKLYPSDFGGAKRFSYFMDHPKKIGKIRSFTKIYLPPRQLDRIDQIKEEAERESFIKGEGISERTMVTLFQELQKIDVYAISLVLAFSLIGEREIMTRIADHGLIDHYGYLKSDGLFSPFLEPAIHRLLPSQMIAHGLRDFFQRGFSGTASVKDLRNSFLKFRQLR